MRKILPYFLLVISPALWSQLPTSIIEPAKRITTFDEYDGSIYTTLKYKDASIIHEKSGSFDAKLRYNAYKDALEYKKDGDLYKIKESPLLHARIGEDYFYYCSFKSQRNITRKGYYVLVELTDGYRIYKKYTTKISKPTKNGSSNGTSTEGKIQIVTTYYLEERGVIVELPLNRKEMLATFNDKENELKSYIKNERIKLRKEEDLIRLVARYNALKSSDSSPSRSLLSNMGQSN